MVLESKHILGGVGIRYPKENHKTERHTWNMVLGEDRIPVWEMLRK